MNSRQLHYAVLLSQTRNFSQVAEQLNISQPALSKQILALENELGVKLFDRNTSPLTLTPAGEHFITQAESLLYKESQLLRSMEQFKSGEAGVLTIGITAFRSTYLIADVLSEVRKAFPGIQIRLCEENSEMVRKDAAEGKFDLAIVPLPVDDSVLHVQPLEPDRLVLVVPQALCNHLPNPHAKAVSFEECKELPFVVASTAQNMRHLFDKLCTRAGFTPNIVVEAVNLTTLWTVAKAGIAATILPYQYVSKVMDEDMRFFDIVQAPYIQQPVVVTRRNQVMTEAAEYAVRLLTEKAP